MSVKKCKICDGDSREKDLCQECEQRIVILKKSIRNAKTRVSKANLILIKT
ncbi:hypothetical protein [Pelotomaculum sp. FP]|uniref:hypothetical protein n=1 Tax=Pelotomaculum sp. FP TaxID=261474 RepID=UPI0018640AED|nr:hypothetical protein [Pelotomaculum sp. FP]